MQKLLDDDRIDITLDDEIITVLRNTIVGDKRADIVL